MKITLDPKDIYDIQIDNVKTGYCSASGCPEGYEDFELDEGDCVDTVYNDNGEISFYVYGKCYRYEYNDSFECRFDACLSMNADEFTSKYADAAENGAKFIKFNGSIDITCGANLIHDIDTSFIGDDFGDTITNIRDECKEYIDYDAFCDAEVENKAIKKIINKMDDNKLINEIKIIDNVEINNKYDYIMNNVLYDNGKLKNEKYNNVYEVLFSELKRLIEDNTVNSIYKEIIKDADFDNFNDTIDVTNVRVFIADLDP